MRNPRPPTCMRSVSRRCGMSSDNPGSCTLIDTVPPMRTARTWIVSAAAPPECTTALVTSSLATRMASSRAAPSSLIWRSAARAMAGASRPDPTSSTRSSRSDAGGAPAAATAGSGSGLSRQPGWSAQMRRSARHHCFPVIRYGKAISSSKAILPLPAPRRPRTSKAALEAPENTTGLIRWSSAWVRRYTDWGS